MTTAKQLQEQFKKETGEDAIEYPVVHGQWGFASWKYQNWLQNKILSEHSTKEPVAWLCEKEGCISRVVSEEEIILHYYKEHGYTITPLVKK